MPSRGRGAHAPTRKPGKYQGMSFQTRTGTEVFMQLKTTLSDKLRANIQTLFEKRQGEIVRSCPVILGGTKPEYSAGL